MRDLSTPRDPVPASPPTPTPTPASLPAPPSAPNAKLDAFNLALKNAAPNTRHQAGQSVKDAFDSITQHIKDDIPMPTILESFNNAFGLTVKLPRFRQLVRNERARRSQLHTETAAVAAAEVQA